MNRTPIRLHFPPLVLSLYPGERSDRGARNKVPHLGEFLGELHFISCSPWGELDFSSHISMRFTSDEVKAIVIIQDQTFIASFSVWLQSLRHNPSHCNTVSGATGTVISKGYPWLARLQSNYCINSTIVWALSQKPKIVLLIRTPPADKPCKTCLGSYPAGLAKTLRKQKKVRLLAYQL